MNKFIVRVVVCCMFLFVGSLKADTVKPNGCKGPDLCSSFPIIDSCGWQLDVGLIFEQMRVSDSTICTSVITKDVAISNTTGGPKYTSNFIRYQFDMEPGVKVGASYYFWNDDWRADANFEWLSSSAYFTGPLDAPVIYKPSDQPVVFFNELSEFQIDFQEAKASLAIDYFLLDVILAKGSYFSGHFTFEPVAGIQSSWISYKMKKSFWNDAFNEDNLPNPPDWELKSGTSWSRLSKTSFWGVGPEVGINASYYIFASWSFFSDANLAVLLGQNALTDYNGFTTMPSTIPPLNKVLDTNNVLCPTARVIVGLQYDRDVSCERQHVTVRAGFDGRYYFNQFPTVTYLGQLINDGTVYAHPSEIGLLNRYMVTNPFIQENNSFGMTGLILDVSWDF